MQGLPRGNWRILIKLSRHRVTPSRRPLPQLSLPRFTVYEANAGRLDHFAASLPRKITFFFDHMGTLAQQCGATTASLPDDTGRVRHFREMQEDLKATLDLADEILLDLRPLVSPHTQAKHLA
jgi:hypothetical protein